TMWLDDIEGSTETVFPDRPAFLALVALHDMLKPTPLFRVGSWLLVCIIVCGVAWRRRETPEGAFALGVCGSAIVYVLTFVTVGVASDFRYGYWAVLAGIVGGVVAALEHDPEKWVPVFRKDRAQTKDRADDDSKKSHPALGRPGPGVPAKARRKES
ncbi:MAG TPA: hypothetical protein VN968_08925, partial [Bradyrhizobium sp.]|nr:hypothetical protein [Bradyrhizobium sp.]